MRGQERDGDWSNRREEKEGKLKKKEREKQRRKPGVVEILKYKGKNMPSQASNGHILSSKAPNPIMASLKIKM